MLSAQAGDVGALLTVVDVVRICQLQKAISTVWTTPSADTSTVLGDTPEFAWPASLSLMWGFSYGLTVLETAANPFLVLCGHPDYAEARLLVAQGVQNVRQRADDRRWEQRGGENELLKLEWFRETREMREAKRTDTDGVISAEDVELEEDSGRRNHHPDQDEAMLGMIEEQEQAEVDALLSSYSPSDYSSQIRPDSPHFSDEDDYDSLFRDFLVQQKSQGSPFSEDVEMSL
ncbi:hypothetical protein P8C59_004702 [Phyllachora maydis]|uniref:Uncharacterized protein n=1 Tax=Phyllachora maydis TaxID=1825666 RepID=A0AAD9MBJ6_9PEZI|nr:hypothetical protein P8C59_004702 [Phyllachora maydis]